MEIQKRCAILTMSDSVSQNLKPDTSGDRIVEMMTSAGFRVVERDCVPDEREVIRGKLQEWSAREDVEVIITTGGTGVGPRDVTPEATTDVIDKALPGMAEAMRMESLKKTPFAMLSRQVVGLAHNTLIVNLPGSPKAVEECLAVVLPMFPHVLNLVAGNTRHD